MRKWRIKNRKRINIIQKLWREKNPDKIKEYTKRYKDRISKYKKIWKKENINHIKQYRKNYYKKFPWRKHFRSARGRCFNKNTYYKRKGIKCLISDEEVKALWFRDKAWLLKKPSIDRKDNDNHYTYSNCRFIELKDNKKSRKTNIRR